MHMPSVYPTVLHTLSLLAKFSEIIAVMLKINFSYCKSENIHFHFNNHVILN